MNDKKTKLKYIGLITIIWLITYIISQILFEQRLGWDEVSYLSVAKGITKDFDFSSRGYTIMGLIKYGYPTHLINFPVFPIYLAIFLKIFGFSIYSAYFSTWLSALGVCILIYLLFLLLSENSHKLAFIASMSYLFSPGMIRNCDTAMMEQLGCLLLCLFVYLILRDYIDGKFNYTTILKFSISFLILWLYKSLFIGYLFGALILILLAYEANICGKKIKTSIPLPVFLFLSYGIFVVLYYIFSKFVFLKVAPMMNFTQTQEYSQVYADFLGGYFTNFPTNLVNNIKYFFIVILGPYFIYPTNYSPISRSILVSTTSYIFVGAYFFLFSLMIILCFASWKKFSPLVKLFACFTISSILGFNLIFNFLFMTGLGNIWRYNLYYFPLYLCLFYLIIKSNLEYIKPFITSHPKVSRTLLLLFFIFGYIPLYISSILQYQHFESMYYVSAKNNAEIIKKFIQNTYPKFVYFNDGTHITWDMYPVKQIFKDATNEQLQEVNKILPEPIEYLFLKSSDWLFKNNQDLILMGAPILNNQYMFYGFDKDAQIIVYKLNR